MSEGSAFQLLKPMGFHFCLNQLVDFSMTCIQISPNEYICYNFYMAGTLWSIERQVWMMENQFFRTMVLNDTLPSIQVFCTKCNMLEIMYFFAVRHFFYFTRLFNTLVLIQRYSKIFKDIPTYHHSLDSFLITYTWKHSTWTNNLNEEHMLGFLYNMFGNNIYNYVSISRSYIKNS